MGAIFNCHVFRLTLKALCQSPASAVKTLSFIDNVLWQISEANFVYEDKKRKPGNKNRWSSDGWRTRVRYRRSWQLTEEDKALQEEQDTGETNKAAADETAEKKNKKKITKADNKDTHEASAGFTETHKTDASKCQEWFLKYQAFIQIY